MNCKDVEIILSEQIASDLIPELLAAVREHASSCVKCSELLGNSLSLDQAISLAVIQDGSQVRSTAKSNLAKAVVGAGPKFFLRVAALAAVATVGHWFGSNQIPPPIPTTSAIAAVLWQDYELVLPVDGQHEQSDALTIDSFEGGIAEWIVPKSHKENLRHETDFGHTGNRSVRLFQRPYGATIRKTFNLPIPADTLVTLSFWHLAPDGGSKHDKWLTAGMKLESNETVVSQDFFQPVAEWQQEHFNLQSTRGHQSLEIEFSTGAGDAHYKGWGLASWIDDVQLAIVLKADNNPVEIDGDEIRVRFKLPNPYRASEIQLESLRLRDDYSKSYQPIAPSQFTIVGEWAVAVFRSKAAVAQLRADNPDVPGEPGAAIVRGRVRNGEYLVPFAAGVK